MFNKELEAAATFATDVTMKYVDFGTDVYLMSLNLFFNTAKIPSAFFEGFTDSDSEETDKVSNIKKSTKK